MGMSDAEIDALYAECDEGVNDEITYKAPGSPALRFSAAVHHVDKTDQFAGSQVTGQDIEITVRKALVPSVAYADRIWLPRLGRWFNPREWKNDRSGLCWIIYVKAER